MNRSCKYVGNISKTDLSDDGNLSLTIKILIITLSSTNFPST